MKTGLDDFLVQDGTEAYKKLCDNALDLPDWLFLLAKKKSGEERDHIIEELIGTLRGRSSVTQERFAKQLVEFGITHQAFIRLLKATDKVQNISQKSEEITEVNFVCETPEPWPSPVDGLELYNELKGFLRSYLILPESADIAMTIWALATWWFETFDCFPYLAITSAQKRCGKTRSLEILQFLSFRSIMTENLSEAVLFRIAARYKPTLLIDEAQILSDPHSERGKTIHDLLCAGNRRNATVYRCCGEKGDKIRGFPIYVPKVVSAIGTIGVTLEDRCIVISMQRKRKDEETKRFLYKRVMAESEELRQKNLRWINDNKDNITNAYAEAEPFDFLNDRDAEHFLALQAVASVLGPICQEELEKSAKALRHDENDIIADLSTRLLKDIQQILENKKNGNEYHEVLPSSDLVEDLKNIAESDWNEIGKNGITPHKLAKFLKPFNLQPKKGKEKNFGKEVRGYWVNDLIPVFKRYLPQSVSTVENAEDNTDTDLDETLGVPETLHNSFQNEPNIIELSQATEVSQLNSLPVTVRTVETHETDCTGGSEENNISDKGYPASWDEVKIEDDDKNNPPEICWNCKGKDFWWKESSQEWVCSICHPEP